MSMETPTEAKPSTDGAEGAERKGKRPVADKARMSVMVPEPAATSAQRAIERKHHLVRRAASAMILPAVQDDLAHVQAGGEQRGFQFASSARSVLASATISRCVAAFVTMGASCASASGATTTDLVWRRA